MIKTSPLKDLAARITQHLKRFEGDENINVYKDNKNMGSTKPYFGAYAFQSGRYVGVKYISYQHTSMLNRDEAVHYLEKLDKGFVGRHYEALREIHINSSPS